MSEEQTNASILPTTNPGYPEPLSVESRDDVAGALGIGSDDLAFSPTGPGVIFYSRSQQLDDAAPAPTNPRAEFLLRRVIGREVRMRGNVLAMPKRPDWLDS